MNRTVVAIGIGNEWRRDDAVGLYIVRELGRRAPDGVQCLECGREGTTLMDRWEHCEAAVIFDAVSAGGPGPGPGAPAGKRFRFDAHQEPLPRQLFCCSTHALSIAETVELARALNKLPLTLLIYGVQGERFDMGESLSAAVKRSADQIVDEAGRILPILLKGQSLARAGLDQ
jgi:hydrogenase maturation protease